jgi:L-2-hydroxyglutarate oxidase LhgO
MSTVDRIDAVVIGAGVIGIAVARALALSGREVMVLEQAAQIGAHASSRNSEVIHAGIYYPPGSLRARFCVEGKRALYDYCGERNVAHRKLGKLIVAINESQRHKLEAIEHNARSAGVSDLSWLTAAEIHELEPNIEAKLALFSPSTGIIDSHAYMLSLHGDAENAGAMFAFNSQVMSISLGAGSLGSHRVVVRSEGVSETEIDASVVVNAAGLFAPTLAKAMQGYPPTHLPLADYAKGHYYALSGASPFRHLVYPLPESGGLGVHVTLDLGGQARFGPDVEWIDAIDYAFDDSRRERFVQAIRQYYPALNADRLQPAYTGIRAKLGARAERGQAFDFTVLGPQTHGVQGLAQLFGIESPGLTSSLAIAAHVAALMD